LKPVPNEIHLPLMFRLAKARRAAADVISFRGAWAQRDVNMWMSSVVVEAVSETNGITGMKPLGELPHDLLHRRVKNLVGIDAGGDKSIVLRNGHREYEAVSDDGPFGRGGKFSQVLEPGPGDSALPLIVRKVRRCGARSVRIDTNAIVKEASGVDLADAFFRGIVREVFELPADLLFHAYALAQGNLAIGTLIEIFQVEPSAGGGFVGENLSVFHERDSRSSIE